MGELYTSLAVFLEHPCWNAKNEADAPLKRVKKMDFWVVRRPKDIQSLTRQGVNGLFS